MLHAIHFGTPGPLPALFIAHGLFGSARNWARVARGLAAARQVFALDMRNHGASPWHASHGYPEMADDIAQAIEALAPEHGPVDLLGHSMGGKAAMTLALNRPGMIRRLVVADIAPVAYGHSHAGHVEAMQRLDTAAAATRAQADRQLSEAIPEPGVRAFLLHSLDFRSKPPRWMLNLDVLAAEMQRITGWPQPAGQFDGPVLMLAGGESHYVLPQHRPTIRALFPKARIARIPGAGHWLHADRPDAFIAAVESFLSA